MIAVMQIHGIRYFEFIQHIRYADDIMLTAGLKSNVEMGVRLMNKVILMIVKSLRKSGLELNNDEPQAILIANKYDKKTLSTAT